MGEKAVSAISCVSGSEVVWKDFVKGRVVAVAGNADKFSVVAVHGSSSKHPVSSLVYLYSASGRRLLPSLVVKGGIVKIGCNVGYHFYILNTRGELSVYNVQTLSRTLFAGVRELLPNQSSELISLELTDDGLPVVLINSLATNTSDGSGDNSVDQGTKVLYCYNPSLESWLTLMDDEFNTSFFRTERSSITKGPL